MYLNFSKHPEEARRFFLAYQDRIVYGTDTGISTLNTGARRRLNVDQDTGKHWYMHMFLETEGPFQAPAAFRKEPETLIGLGLPEEALRKVYRDNFLRLVGGKPARLNHSAAAEECQRLARIDEEMGDETGSRPSEWVQSV